MCLTAAGKLSDVESVMEKADDLHGGEKSSLTGSATLKVNQHGMSDDRQSTQWENKGHVCDVCNKVFTHNCYLVRHKRIHARYRYGKHTASKYNKGCKQSGSSLPVHNMSSGERSVVSSNLYYCDICGLAVQCMSKIISHMRTHMRKKPYACEKCMKAFIRPSDLTVHMRTHTGEKPFACELCKRAFNHPGHLQRHMRTHTGEKPYACKVCKRAFTQPSHVTRHMHTHTKRQATRV
jgi:uncharacterized Zn-finger protein